MKLPIAELRKGKFEGEVQGTIVEMGEAKDVMSRYGTSLRVANGVLEDESGKIGLALWNDDIERFKPGDRVKITNGYVSEFRGELKVSGSKGVPIEKIE
ncbi:MAG: SOSS complex subunit B family protein [Candidatus Anstonellales archaeon]